MTRVLIIPGSSRKESVNRKLAGLAGRIVEEIGGSAEVVDPSAYQLPLYDQDLEDAEGLPEAARRLKRSFVEADALVFCSPEYNSSISPLLKNMIDWVSRAESDDEPPMAAYRGKVAGLLSASPGGLGGMRGLVHLRSILGNIGVWVVPDQMALGGAYGKFDEEGSLNDARDLARLREVLERTVEGAGRLAGS